MSIDNNMRLFSAQEALFSEKPSRLDLTAMDLPFPSTPSVSVNVWRNHGFEPLEIFVSKYLQFGKLAVKFRISGYDDSLSFAEYQDASAELLWLDSERLLGKINFEEWLNWLEARIAYLRSISNAPIIIATWFEDEEHCRRIYEMASGFPAVYFAELSNVCKAAAVPLIDKRSAVLAGTPLSGTAQIMIARELACHWLSGVLLPPIKAIALDLDYTLHSGVLGEEGVQGVRLTEGHRALQQTIKELQQRGIFIALISRNERADVEKLFAERKDYPLRWEDFSVTEISWGDKAKALEKIANALRISTDAVLFVDDNPGELASVMQQLPQVHALHAHEDAFLTRRAISFYPGLWRWKIDADDAKRILDLKASAEREIIAEYIKDPVEYFRSLKVSLTYRQNPKDQLSRLADLCNKTNQFNLSLRRFTETEVSEHLARNDCAVASVQLSDRLSDSGVIAVLVAERVGSCLIVEELCVSCRALGRELETSIIVGALRMMPIFSGCEEVAFRAQVGPRNQPALNWLAKLIGMEAPMPAGLHVISANELLAFRPVDGVDLIY